MSRLESEYHTSDLYTLYELRISDELFNLKVVAEISVMETVIDKHERSSQSSS